MNKHTLRCLVCHGDGLDLIRGFSRLPRITSDCRPFRAGGELAQCADCGAVQKRPSTAWLGEIAEIYRDYEAYYQANGREQISFDRKTGTLRRRSAILVDRLNDRIELPMTGALLDVGCGSGVTLRAFAEQRPNWHLDGYELGDRNLDRLHALRQFGKLHTGSIKSIQSRYELITMIHSLEHLADPKTALDDLRPCLANDGRLFIEVCNIEENPFDVLIADHLMHFSPATLGTLLERSGLTAISVATDWVGREISATATMTNSVLSAGSVVGRGALQGWARLDATLAWLDRFTEAARNAADANARFAIFGTSISGTWLASQLGEAVAFFVDEDPSRIGKRHLGRPIVSPLEVSIDATVYLALTPKAASAVRARFIDHPATWLLPPSEPF